MVPVYNTATRLQKCFDSIAKQTFDDFEVIVVDDGSIDGSGAICDEYAAKDLRFRVFHKENEHCGPAPAAKLALEKAIGTYSIRVDSDDWIEPNMLQEMYDKIIEDNSDILFVDYFSLDAENHSTYVKSAILSPNPKVEDVIKCMLTTFTCVSMWSKLVRHSLYKQHNIFNRGVGSAEDLLVSIELMMIEPLLKLSYLSKAYYNYWYNAVSVTNSLNKSKYDGWFKNGEMIKCVLEKHNKQQFIKYIDVYMTKNKYLMYVEGLLSSQEYYQYGKTHLVFSYYKAIGLCPWLMLFIAEHGFYDFSRRLLKTYHRVLRVKDKNRSSSQSD
ncbi:MAG: glycosyltransferase [Bacteroidales bacterium]|nr:glycosyltransferase [Bacteroidales bacterium]